MSIFHLRMLNLRTCQRTIQLAQSHLRFRPALQLAMVNHVATARNTSSQSNLFQMVKKRTLEARTKLQATKYPYNQPCLPPKKVWTPPKCDASTQKAARAHVKACTTPDPPTPAPACPPTEPIKTAKPTNSQKKVPVCTNADLLRAGGCDDSSKPPKGPVCDGTGGSGSGKDGQDNSLSKNQMCLYALLAALGLGALLLYLLMRKSRDEPKATVCPDVDQVQQIPPSSANLPKHVPYLLIGGGTASFSAFRAIKSNDPTAKILIISNELKKPYMRPPLSKELWYTAKKGEISHDYRFKQWTGTERSLYFEPDAFFMDPTRLMDTVNGGVAVAHGFAVKKIDPDRRVAILNDGYEIGYDECLIATGCSPKNLHLFENATPSVKEKVMVYRTPEDFEKLKWYADQNKSITIIGNGFIGSELACSLADYSKDKRNKIYQIFPEAGNMSKVLPDYLSRWTTRKVEALGVCVMPRSRVKEVRRDESMLKLVLDNGNTIMTDIAVVCVGCEPNTEIANVSGLETDRQLGGFVVNAELEARRNLFVAGDASCFYDPLLGRRRVEHHDHSVVSGRLAGENMVGKKKAYTHQSMFWSDLGPEIGYEGIGMVDSCLPTVGVFALPSKPDRTTDNLTETTPDAEVALRSTQELPDITCDPQDQENYGRGVIFYLKDDKIVGVLMWNIFNRVSLARTIINQNKKYDDLNEVAKLFEIHA